jgi:protein-L-isoaspartate(D-aspartate) O-methyltransferase
MTDFAHARRVMVEGQIRTYSVTDLRVLGAMLEIPRERFLPAESQVLAYADLELPVTKPRPGKAPRCLLRPEVLGRLIQEAEVGPMDRILDVGCATGYSTAVLSRIGANVVGLEEDPELAAAAKANVAAFAHNVSIVTGPLIAGAPKESPFDVIFLEGATEIVPEKLFPQLKDQGRLACVVGRTPGRATIYRSAAGHVTGYAVFDAAAPLLPGFVKPAAFVF